MTPLRLSYLRATTVDAVAARITVLEAMESRNRDSNGELAAMRSVLRDLQGDGTIFQEKE